MPKNMFRQSLFLSVAVVCCIEGLTFDPRRCRQQQTCGQCQAVSPECSWCADENYSWNRCDRMDYQERSRCRRESVVNHTSTSTVRRGRPIGDRVLISPQYIQSNLYKGRPSTFTIRVKVTDKDLRRRRVGLRARTVQGTRVDIISDCPGYDDQATSCPRIRQGQIIEFRVTLTVNTCNGRQRLRLGAPGVRGRVVRADITSKCQCDCESQPSSDDPRCSNNGRFSCGVCQCYRGRFGERCECDAEAGSEQCMASNSSLACSGRGDCVCGRCSCHTGSRSRQPYYGQFCECNDFSCNLHNRQLCGGAERGRCLCGRCMCNTGYRGQACEQSTDTSTCLARNQRICNNHGLCLGGVCRCDRPYAGPTCEDCPTCMGRCSELKNCVLCFAFSSGPLSREECHAQCSYIDINIVDVATPADASTNYCTFVDDSDGSFFFFNYWDEETTRVSVQRTKVFAGR